MGHWGRLAWECSGWGGQALSLKRCATDEASRTRAGHSNEESPSFYPILGSVNLQHLSIRARAPDADVDRVHRVRSSHVSVATQISVRCGAGAAEARTDGAR